MDVTLIILVASTLLQFAAAFLAFRLIRVAGRRTAWVLISVALSLMAVRRGLTLYGVLAGNQSTPPDFTSELIALAISAAMVAGITLIAPFFRSAVRSERELRESEQHYHVVAETASDAIITVDEASTILFVNPAVEKIFGYAAGEVMGQPLTMLMPEYLRHVHQAGMKRYLDTGRRHISWEAIEVPGLHKSGRELPLELSFGEFLKDGKHVFTGIARDITARKRADAELRDVRARLEAALEAGSIATWTWDVKNDRLFADENLARLFSVSPEEAAGGTLASYTRVIHPEDLPRVSALISSALESGDRYEAEYRVVQPDGSSRWVVARGRVERDAEGEALGLSGVVVDITERKVAEDVVRESERQLRTLADAVPQLVWMADADGFIFWYNERWYDYTGTTPGEMEGWGWQSVHDPELLPKVLERWRASIETGAPFEMEFPLKGADGVFRWFLTRVNPLRDSQGRIVRWFGTNTDVDGQRRTAEELRKANRLKDEFLATLSHELRTPLTAIIGWSHMLRSSKLDERTVATALETIERNAKAQSQLIEDLMDVSRIVTGKLRLDVQTVDLAQVIEAAVAAARPAAEGKSIRLQTTLDPSAGPVSGDPSRLQQVIWNLLTNAVKFTPKGGRVQVMLERINSHVEITVADTGQGIAPEFLPHVFDRFRQADQSHTRAHGGLGLGLSIVRQLAELHGGTVGVESAGEGRGATFVVRLPVMVALRKTEQPERRHPTAGEGGLLDCPPSLAGLRVLVVDDEADTRAILRTVLEHCGSEVMTAASAAEALPMFEQFKPDILISDIGMPEEDGYQFMRRVRALEAERGGRVPAIALTAYARVEDRVRALNVGYQVHVPKPIEPVELAAVVASLAGRTVVS